MKAINQSVYRVSFGELSHMKGFDKCVDEYRSKCRMTGTNPVTINDLESYKKDILHLYILAVMHGDECVGFCGMFKTFYPHLNSYVMCVESLFIRSSFTGRYWFRLFSSMRKVMSDENCDGMILSAQTGTRFDRLLAKRYTALNTLYWVENKHE